MRSWLSVLVLLMFSFGLLFAFGVALVLHMCLVFGVLQDFGSGFVLVLVESRFAV